MKDEYSYYAFNMVAGKNFISQDSTFTKKSHLLHNEEEKKFDETRFFSFWNCDGENATTVRNPNDRGRKNVVILDPSIHFLEEWNRRGENKKRAREKMVNEFSPSERGHNVHYKMKGKTGKVALEKKKLSSNYNF